MESEVIFSPKSHSSFRLFLFMVFCFFRVAKAEITCRSCQPGNKWRAQELLLKFDTSEYPTGLKREVFEHGDGAVRSAASGAESRLLRSAAGSAECAPDIRVESAEQKLPRSTENQDAGGSSGESKFAKAKVSNVETSGEQKTRPGASRYRKNSDNDDDDDKSRPAGREPREDRRPAAGRRRVTRSDSRWRGAGPRQEEQKLNSSTFALTGDSSHNQAMVHWSGHNSSVSDSSVPFAQRTGRKRQFTAGS
ncbi:sorcs1 [Pungitius sinensis]